MQAVISTGAAKRYNKVGCFAYRGRGPAKRLASYRQRITPHPNY